MSERPPEAPPFRLMFVCTGNTCRSPMAEAIALALAEGSLAGRLEVRSAGVGAFPGAPPSDGALRIARAHGLDLSGHRATLLTRNGAEWADLILTMSPSHLMRVVELGAGDRSALLTSFVGSAGGAVAVPDPIGGPDEAYEATYRMLSELVAETLERLRPVLAP